MCSLLEIFGLMVHLFWTNGASEYGNVSRSIKIIFEKNIFSCYGEVGQLFTSRMALGSPVNHLALCALQLCLIQLNF